MNRNPERRNPKQGKTLIRLTVGRKIAMGFSVGTLLTLAVGIAGLYGVVILTGAMDFMERNQILRLYSIERLDYQRILHRSLLYEIHITKDEEDRIARIERIKDIRRNLLQDIDAEWVNLGEIPLVTPEGRMAYQELKERYTAWRWEIQGFIDQAVDQLIRISDPQKLPGLYQRFTGLEEQARVYSDEYESALLALRKVNNQYMGRNMLDNAALGKGIINLVLGFMILGVLIAVALGIIVTRLITIPVKQALVLLKAMSQGDLNRPIETTSNDEIGEMIHLLRHEIRAKLEAEAASQAKSNFLATMSHEIRTPLNTILGLTEIELQKPLPEDTRLGLEKIQNSGSSLLGIINTVLDISKIEAGSFELIPVEYDVPSLINDTIQLNILLLGSKPVSFTLELDETLPSILCGDELRVKQILNNLLSNAFKYTKEGQVVLDIRHERKEQALWLIFTVSDTGIGIKPEELDTIFSKYSQLDSKRNRAIEGTGLGLFITKGLIDLMEGAIQVESEYGRGSRFTVRIPQKLVKDTGIEKETMNNLKSLRFIDPRRRGKSFIRDFMPYGKVLVVDDVPANLEVAKGLLLPYGLYVDCAAGGQEAIDLIRQEQIRYDLIFMDHMMPSMDGISAARIIRGEINTGYARTVPIIALTANALTGSEAMFLSNGFNGFISKPIDIMRLDAALNRWIRDKQSAETLKQAAKEKQQLTESPFLDSAPGLLEGYTIPGLDLAAGAARYEPEEEYIKILKTYMIQGEELVDRVQDVSAESLREYAVTMHGFRGASCSLGADAIGKAAYELEAAAKAGDLETIHAKTPAFLNMLRVLLGDIRKLLEQADSAVQSKPREPAAAPDPALLEKLLDASVHYRITVMEEIISSLENYDYETGGPLVRWLREQTDTLEYGAIQDTLTALRLENWRIPRDRE
jgi:signal transduction histidine kinase/DNA-binding NarL/FixJ family response regulator